MKNLKRLVTGSWQISYPKITVKQKYTPFHKKSAADDLYLKLSAL